ncbi:MAG: tetratricopeptide repeat protein, partial [Bacteroidota bacterium]
AINGDGNNPGLEEIVSGNSVSKSGNLAKLYLGFAYMKNKEYDKAIDALKSYSAEDVMTASLSLCLIGDAYMELKNTDEAIGYYEKATKEKANNFATPVALMKLATALESKGSYKEAVDVYERIRKDYPTSSEGTQAEKYAARASAMAGN